MSTPTLHTTQIATPFGSGYVPEQHGDGARRNLPPPEKRNFGEALANLRAALSLRWRETSRRLRRAE
jgi:hypothetical protein